MFVKGTAWQQQIGIAARGAWTDQFDSLVRLPAKAPVQPLDGRIIAYAISNDELLYGYLNFVYGPLVGPIQPPQTKPPRRKKCGVVMHGKPGESPPRPPGWLEDLTDNGVEVTIMMGREECKFDRVVEFLNANKCCEIVLRGHGGTRGVFQNCFFKFTFCGVTWEIEVKNGVASNTVQDIVGANMRKHCKDWKERIIWNWGCNTAKPDPNNPTRPGSNALQTLMAQACAIDGIACGYDCFARPDSPDPPPLSTDPKPNGDKSNWHCVTCWGNEVSVSEDGEVGLK